MGSKQFSNIKFSTRRRHEDFTVFYTSQSYFGLPRQSIKNYRERLILFKQTIRDVQSLYYDIGGYDMKYDEYKIMCQKAWNEKFNYFRFDMSKNKNEGKYRIFNESKTKYIECAPEKEPFQKTYDSYSHKYFDMYNYSSYIQMSIITNIKVSIHKYN